MIVEGGGVGSASASHGFSTAGMYAVTAAAAAVARDGRRTTVSQTVVVTGRAAPNDGTAPSNI